MLFFEKTNEKQTYSFNRKKEKETRSITKGKETIKRVYVEIDEILGRSCGCGIITALL